MLEAWREAVERARPAGLGARLEQWMVPARLSVVGPSAAETAEAAGAALDTPVPASGSVSVSTPAPGARLVVRHESGPRVAVRVVFTDARRTEPPTRPGVAALAGYSLASRLNARASVDADDVTLSFDWSTDDAAARLARLARTLRAPRPRAEDLEAARATLRRALVAPAAEPAAERALASALFGDHPYARDPSGALGALSELTVTDVRAELAHRLAPGPVTIVVVGPVAPALAERLFRDALHDRTTLDALPEAGAPLVARQGRVQETVRARRAAVWWAWPLAPPGEDIRAAAVLAEVVAEVDPEVRARVLRGRVGGALVLAAAGSGARARGRLAAAVERLRAGVEPDTTRSVLTRLAGRAALEGGDPEGRARLLAQAAVAGDDVADLPAAADQPAARWTALDPRAITAAATRILTVPPPVDLELQPTAEVSQREPAPR
jgi:predicted Zn-dependent peptidase